MLIYWCCAPALADSGLSDEKQRLQQLQAKINQTKASIRKMESREHSVALKLETIERNYAEITKTLDNLTTQANHLQKKLNAIITQKNQQTLQLQIQQNNLANQFRSAYRSGRRQQWRLLLSQTDPSALARHMVYFHHLNQTRLNQINTVRTLLTTIESLEAKTLSIKQALESKRQSIQREQRTLEQTRSKRSRLLDEIREKIQEQKNNLSTLIKHEKQLQRLVNEISHSIKELDLAIVNKQPFYKLKGKLPWPVKTWSSFQRRVINNRAQGLLIKTSEGADVSAVARGRVVFSDWMPGYGLLIIIEHGSNYLSLYANNQNLKTVVGQKVSAGEVIALAGASGGRAESALYFEIRKKKRQENPLRWLVRQTRQHRQ